MAEVENSVVTGYYVFWFPIYLFIIQVSGAVFMGLVFIIVHVFLHGYEYVFVDERGRNLHMVLAPLAFVYLTGQGMLFFRIMQNVTSQTVKAFHTYITTASFLIGVLAIFAMWNGKEVPLNPYWTYKNTPTVISRLKYTPKPANIEHFNDFHSYLGYLTSVCFLIEYLFAVFLYLMEVDLYYKDIYSGIHGYLGTFTLFVSTITSVCGVITIFNDRRYFWFARYIKRKIEFGIGYYCCLSGLSFSFFVLFVILNPKFEWLPIGPV